MAAHKKPDAANDRPITPFGRPGGFGSPPGHMAGMPKSRPKNIAGTMRRLGTYLRRHIPALIIVFMFVVVGSLMQLASPWLIGMAIDTMVGRGQGDLQQLALIVAALAGTYLIASLTTWVQIRSMIHISQNIVRTIRGDLFAKLQTLPVAYFDRKPHGELMSRITNDVESVNNTLTQAAPQLMASIIMIIGTLSLMLYLNVLLTVVTLVSVPLGLFAMSRVGAMTRKYFSAQQKSLGELNGYVEEMISGQRVVKAYCHEKRTIDAFSVINRRLNEAGIRAQIFTGIIGPLMNVVNNFGFALVAAAGGLLAVRGIITIGVIAAFTNYARHFFRPISELANQYNMIQSALAGAERVFEVMDERAEFAGQTEAIAPVIAGTVSFENVRFGYDPAVPVLKNVHLTAHPGQTIALVGPTGAGKTTIVNLLTRFYDIDEGTIRVDGHDIRTIDKDVLRGSLGMVLQDTYLFSGSVRENIRYGRLNASDEEIREAARLANADAFIEHLPDGYDTVLSDDAVNISQGQRQLITIARAILANPSILILDEATSSVDTRTEMHIQEAMKKLMKGRTSFVIAHRLSTIRDADEILVIKDGEIVERGDHRSLLAERGFYHELYDSFRRGM
ncbi:MAG: ABC transporter ATP-binding protein [Spirochaetota bacterium]